MNRPHLKPRRGEYGFDAPYVPALMICGSLPLLIGAGQRLTEGALLGGGLMGLSGAFLLFCAGTFIFTTRWGKFLVWNELLTLHGDERVLDVGCGRGAVLLLAARRLTTGKATGIDLWQAKDQSGNAVEATQRNAAAEGVQVELLTGDMRTLPFADARFDVVVSSLAIHNVPDAAGREQAVKEIARVLKPGGRVLIADFKFTADYAKTLADAGLRDVQSRGLGPRFWYGGPWAATSLVTASRASPSISSTLLEATSPVVWGEEELAALVRTGDFVSAITRRDGIAHSLLHTAAQLGDLAVLRGLLDAGAEIDAANLLHETPLIHAARAGQLEAVALLLSAGADVEAHHLEGWTALSTAVINGHEAIVELLLRHRPNLDREVLTPGMTPVRMAVQIGNPKILRWLLEAGARSDLRGFDGRTPLELARKLGHAECEQVLQAGR